MTSATTQQKPAFQFNKMEIANASKRIRINFKKRLTTIQIN